MSFDVKTDTKLQYGMPLENEIRLRYPFANLYFSFPTKPYVNNNILFPAYLKKINDVITPEFAPTKVFGRTDPIPTYKYTARKISVDFDIPAFSEYDANNIVEKFNTLMRNLYPGFLQNKGQYVINSPPLVRVKFANLISNPLNSNLGLLGYPDAVTINHDFNTQGTFVIAENNGYVYAKSYSLSFNLNVLHESIVGWDDDSRTFIGRSDDTDGPSGKGEFPYNIIKDNFVPSSSKAGSAVSNLRGSLVSNPATLNATTKILGTTTSNFSL